MVDHNPYSAHAHDGSDGRGGSTDLLSLGSYILAFLYTEILVL